MSRSKELALRVASTVIFVPLLIYSLFFEQHFLLPLILGIAGLWALFEYYSLMAKTGFHPFCLVGYMVLVILLVFTDSPEYFNPKISMLLWILIPIGITAYLLSSEGGTPSLFSNIGITLLGILYIGWPFALLNRLHHLPSGAWSILWLILVTWFCDIGAYLIGSAVGKHKLCPNISPGKTIEGLIGGVLMSLLAAALAWWIFKVNNHPLGFSMAMNILLALVVTLTGVVGDLAESILKRQARVKDSGNTFTGHGGMLDIIDSLLFTAPIFYYTLQLLV